MPSARVEINDYNLRVDPTMPAIMKGRVAESEWKFFCEQVDEHLQGLKNIKKCFYIYVGIVVAGFLLTMVGIVLSFQMSPFGSTAFVLFLIPLGLMIGLIIFACFLAKTANSTYEEVQRVCEEASKKQTLVSYHLRKDVVISGSGDHSNTHRNSYIEISISDTPIHQGTTTTNAYATPGSSSAYTTMTAPSPYSSSAASPYVSNYASSSATSTESRLRDLENIKHLLTSEEYRDKRADILATV